MKNNIDNFMKKSLAALNRSYVPTQEQKDAILSKVLVQANTQNISKISTIKSWIFVYPWRFAFGASTLQAVILTAVFGSKYTDLILQFIGR